MTNNQPPPDAVERDKLEAAARLLAEVRGHRDLDHDIWLNDEKRAVPVWQFYIDKATELRDLFTPSRAKAAEILSAPPAPIGWLYGDDDFPITFSPDHPVESGNDPYATDIRPATPENLLEALKDAWTAQQDAHDHALACVSPPAPPAPWTREELARELNPDAFKPMGQVHINYWMGQPKLQEAALALADRILSRPAPTVPTGGKTDG